MAENASAIREALEEKRSGVAETLATGQKADVRDRLAETAREVGGQAKEHLAEYATQAKSKASELRDQADQLTDSASPAVDSTARGSMRRWSIGAAVLLAIIVWMMARRRPGNSG